MPDIADPRYFQQLARTLDRITAELPTAEQLRRGDDISPAIRTLISDVGCLLTEISEELVTSYRHEIYDRPAHGPAERYGTAALAQCATPLGASLGRLGQVIERLGFLHQHLLKPTNSPRIPISGLRTRAAPGPSRPGRPTDAHRGPATAHRLRRTHPDPYLAVRARSSVCSSSRYPTPQQARIGHSTPPTARNRNCRALRASSMKGGATHGRHTRQHARRHL